MKIKIVYNAQKTEKHEITNPSDLEVLISSDVVSVVIDDEIYYKLGDRFVYIPTSHNSSHYLALLNDILNKNNKEKLTLKTNERNYSTANA